MQVVHLSNPMRIHNNHLDIQHVLQIVMTVRNDVCAQGENFEAICRMTDIFEGSIIRATRRLDELMSEVSSAAWVIGDVGLQEKFKESAATIRRDIMFAASLYI